MDALSLQEDEFHPPSKREIRTARDLIAHGVCSENDVNRLVRNTMRLAIASSKEGHYRALAVCNGFLLKLAELELKMSGQVKPEQHLHLHQNEPTVEEVADTLAALAECGVIIRGEEDEDDS